MPFWVRVNGGIWNANPSADPAAGIGGVSLASVASQTLYGTGQATGDAIQTFNFGASSFAGAVPGGFTAGIPHVGGGWTTLDPAKAQGSVTLSGGNLVMLNNTTPGFCQTVDGYSTGKYYFEITYTDQDIFNNFAGGGVGVDFTAGGNFNFWFANGAFAVDNNFGGAVLIGGAFETPPWQARLGAFGTSLIDPIFEYPEGAVLGIAFEPESALVNTEVGIADLWFDGSCDFVDMRVVSNRRKFVSELCGAQFLGASGEIPLGVVPPVFLTRLPSQAPNAFADNNGAGGDFVITDGPLTDAGTSPPCTPYSVVLGPLSDIARNTPPGADPQVRLSYSDDGGRTWSTSKKWRSMGKIGEYLKRLRWLKMGQFRQRIIRLEITDPVRRNIVGFYLDTGEGMG